MSKNNPNLNKITQQSSRDLHSLFRSQIVQKYPPDPEPENLHQSGHLYSNPVFLEEEHHFSNQHEPQQHIDFVDCLWGKDHEIVEEYMVN